MKGVDELISALVSRLISPYDYWKRAGLPKGTAGGTMGTDSLTALQELWTTSFQESTVSLHGHLTTERQR